MPAFIDRISSRFPPKSMLCYAIYAMESMRQLLMVLGPIAILAQVFQPQSRTLSLLPSKQYNDEAMVCILRYVHGLRPEWP